MEDYDMIAENKMAALSIMYCVEKMLKTTDPVEVALTHRVISMRTKELYEQKINQLKSEV